MIGAIVVVGFVAAASSFLATLTNLVVWRKFPGVGWNIDPALPEAFFLRVTTYRVVAKVFYRQAQVFWTLFILLIVLNVLSTIIVCSNSCLRIDVVNMLSKVFSAVCNLG